MLVSKLFQQVWKDFKTACMEGRVKEDELRCHVEFWMIIFIIPGSLRWLSQRAFQTVRETEWASHRGGASDLPVTVQSKTDERTEEK